MTTRVRYKYFDYLNVICAFGVVALHCSTSVFLNTGDLRWKLDVIVQAVFSLSVPVFFMISGANLLGYRERYSTKTFFDKRLRRTFGALLAFSALFYALACIAPAQLGLVPRTYSLQEFIDLFLTNGINDIYWFFYSILILYAMTPLLSLLAERERLLGYVLLLSGVSTFVIPFWNRFMPESSSLSLFSVPYLKGHIFYYLLGFYLHRYVDLSQEKRKRGLLVVGLACLVVVVVMTIRTNMLRTQPGGSGAEYDNFYISTLSPLVATYAASLFLSLKEYLQEHSFGALDRAIKAAAPYCLGVYGIHMLFIHIFDVYIPHSIKWDLGLRPFVVFGLSMVSVAVWRALKGLLASLCGKRKNRVA